MQPTAMTAASTAKLTPKPRASTPRALDELADITAMNAEHANDPKIWRNEVTMALPWARSSIGRAAHPYAVSGIIRQATPTVRTP